jgi:diguanylate cyclase
MQGQMSDFLQLIQDERSSLAEFAKIIDEASQAISSDKNLDRFALAKSINNLSKATAQQTETNKSLSNAAAAQSAAVVELKNEIEALEALKWTDKITGLANRRSFHKTVVGAYANPNRPTPCGLVFGEFDDFRNYSTSGEYPFSGNYLREIADVFKSANTSGQFIAYLDKGRFAFVLNSEDPGEIMVFVEMLRKAIKAKKPLVTKRRSGNAEITLSFGIAMATDAGGAHELIQHAEKALSDSIADSGNTVTFYATGKPTDSRKNWMIYASN